MKDTTEEDKVPYVLGGSNCEVVCCGCCSYQHTIVGFHNFPKSHNHYETDGLGNVYNL